MNLFSENRQRGRFAGFSLFVSNTGDMHSATLCYKDGPQLPPLNFTSICTESGRYVIFYNERLDGLIYPNSYEVTNVITEICEVTIQGKSNTKLKSTFLTKTTKCFYYYSTSYLKINEK